MVLRVESQQRALVPLHEGCCGRRGLIEGGVVTYAYMRAVKLTVDHARSLLSRVGVVGGARRFFFLFLDVTKFDGLLTVKEIRPFVSCTCIW